MGPTRPVGCRARTSTDETSAAGSALSGLDAVLNAPKRLAIMAVLSSSSSTDFGFLRRRHLGVSESDLSKQAATLESAGYLTIHKSGHGRGGVTTYKATRSGRKAYQRHRDTLRALIAESLADD